MGERQGRHIRSSFAATEASDFVRPLSEYSPQLFSISVEKGLDSFKIAPVWTCCALSKTRTALIEEIVCEANGFGT